MENGQEVRAVDIDPERAPLVQWAFEAYATGDWTLRQILNEVTKRGLTTRPGPHTPAKRLSLNGLSKLLANRYYIGEVSYAGVRYPGKHDSPCRPVLVRAGPVRADGAQLRRGEAASAQPLLERQHLLRQMRKPARCEQLTQPHRRRLRLLLLHRAAARPSQLRTPLHSPVHRGEASRRPLPLGPAHSGADRRDQPSSQGRARRQAVGSGGRTARSRSAHQALSLRAEEAASASLCRGSADRPLPRGAGSNHPRAGDRPGSNLPVCLWSSM